MQVRALFEIYISEKLFIAYLKFTSSWLLTCYLPSVKGRPT